MGACNTKVVTVIPARMAATRLPGKPLADIAGQPMIVRVWQRAVAAALGEVVVATDDATIKSAVESAGGCAVMTRDDHASGSDRIAEAVSLIASRGDADVVLNLQGDLPIIAPDTIRAAVATLTAGPADIATLGAEIVDEDERTNPNVVKVVGDAFVAG